MKVVWLSDDARQATVMRGLFKIWMADLVRTDDMALVHCPKMACNDVSHSTGWKYVTTGNPVDHRVVHALMDHGRGLLALKREAESMAEWVRPGALPSARLLKSAAVVLLLAALSSGCLASSVATLGADAYQTTVIAADGWPHGRTEDNAVLGSRPGATAVVAYMVGVEALVVLLDRELPPVPRRLFHVVFTVAEGATVYLNARCDRGHCDGQR